MDPETAVSSSGVFSLERYAMLTGRTFKDSLIRAARGAVRHVIRITPPFNADGGPDSPTGEAKARGARAIERDLETIFAPVRLKRKRKERISGAEMVGIHLRHLKIKRPGKPMRRYGGPYFVDRRKFSALANKLRSHVGRLAAGWLPAVATIGATATPGWVSRHTGRGYAQLELDGASMYFQAVNQPHNLPAALAAELDRRVSYATQYQFNGMQRELNHLLLRDATKAGLSVA